ncbi:MAG: DUF6067 family protein [Flavobacteriaceae bacterium]
MLFREQQLNENDFDMSYKIGHWEHPDYSKSFKSLGNHRIIIKTKSLKKSLNQVTIPWRRKDNNPELKKVIIVNTRTKKPIEHVALLQSTAALGHLVFESEAGNDLYQVYYLPHHSTGGYYPKLQYDIVEPDSNLWLANLHLDTLTLKNLPQAKVLTAESIDAFNSFYPMEIIATKKEVRNYINTFKKPFYVFPEYRENSIRMTDFLPMHWVKKLKNINALTDMVKRGEHYTLQVGVFSPNDDLENIETTFSDLTGKSGVISKSNFTCFNTKGVDLNGKKFTKKVSLKKGKVQALWFGINIPEDAKAGEYLTSIFIKPKNKPTDTVFVKLNITSELIENHGDNKPQNMTRLQWLNSTIGTDKNFIVKPFEPVTFKGKSLSILGRKVTLNKMGLPLQIASYFKQELTKFNDIAAPILVAPMTFEVQASNDKEIWKSKAFTIQQAYKSKAHWQAKSSSKHFDLEVNGTLEYDGMLNYHIKLIAKQDFKSKDIKLSIPMQKDAATYMLGLGHKGSKRPKTVHWKWDTNFHQEGVWLGAVNKGLQFVLRDNNYEQPLNTNFYHNKPLNLPTSWGNDNKGGIDIKTFNDKVLVENYSGSRNISKNDTLNFNIRFLITPFKKINTKTHFSTRFVHKYVPLDSVLKWKGTVVNVHHANEINPYINYPFYNSKLQKEYITKAHRKGIKVKLYNTIRELSYKAYELFALKSLGTEIFNDGKGGGHSWLQEHLKSHYHAAWHATETNDAAILDKGNSRWTNYYIEGINWLAKYQKIDGLYLDDVAFNRTTMKRIASVLSKNRPNYIIDLHSANQFNPRDGFTNSAMLYMEHMPFISRLWFGEYFQYDRNPDYWLTEVSGLPFGLTGEMLEKGGQPWRGMVYGMTNRIYLNHNPRPLWQLFDDFDIANSEMLGYWVDRSPIKTHHKNIKSTVYLNKDRVLIAIGSWSHKTEYVNLKIDYNKLGFDPDKVKLVSPKIEGMQNFNTYDVGKKITIPKNKGLILILSKR